jgi:hypothetical protein
VQVILWDPFLHKKIHTIPTGHHGNIFSVKVWITYFLCNIYPFDSQGFKKYRYHFSFCKLSVTVLSSIPHIRYMKHSLFGSKAVSDGALVSWNI